MPTVKLSVSVVDFQQLDRGVLYVSTEPQEENILKHMNKCPLHSKTYLFRLLEIKGFYNNMLNVSVLQGWALTKFEFGKHITGKYSQLQWKLAGAQEIE